METTTGRKHDFDSWFYHEYPDKRKNQPYVTNTESYGYSVKFTGGKIIKFNHNHQRIFGSKQYYKP